MIYSLANLLGIVIIGGATIFLIPSHQPPPQPHDVYWGPGEQPKTLDQSIRPFKISFSKEMIDDLRFRLKNTRKLQSSLENVAWTYGIRSDYVPKVVDHWLNKYDFKKREAHLNQYPQFITNVQGLDIHYIHVKPQLPKDHKLKILPLYLQHGWPGSVVEFYKIIPMLTTPRPNYDFVFEVVIPSLPGFGYSDAAAKAGLGTVEIALVMKNLMLRLGFDKWYTQGGDWGASITSNMASMYPQHVLGMHSNMCVVFRVWTWIKMGFYSLWPLFIPEDEVPLMFPLLKHFYRGLEETGYLHEQATKPDTLGVGMSDSPAGLAAYILDKFSTATNLAYKLRDDGGLLEKFTMEELIDNLMYYWVPNKSTSAFRIYAETFNKRFLNYIMTSVPITVPSACAQFPHEIIFQSELFLRDHFINLVHRKKMPKGGHFAALEEPQLLADDIFEAVKKMREFDATNKKKKI
ncbi:juvenile hormone epoxide hydrolase 1-like [Phymastichus coffea]|uniref:juvenile hormone epoxide hydrolase 1-like n=1 Tax=Phymastichus coffea TaxID=108790 RepID=UPI00273CE60F|nr:juvenile hormone epoxide hydrolase 1-like [Phymastichus coffea]